MIDPVPDSVGIACFAIAALLVLSKLLDWPRKRRGDRVAKDPAPVETRPPRPPAKPTVPRTSSRPSASAPPDPAPIASRAPPGQSSPAAFGDRVTGHAYVIDGDTIIIDRIRLRIWGIDAPELDEPWGLKSKWAMVDICKGHRISAFLTGDKSYERFVARCYLPCGTDVAEALVRRGLALDWPLFSNGAYRRFEQPEFRRRLSHVRRKMKQDANAAQPGSGGASDKAASMIGPALKA